MNCSPNRVSRDQTGVREKKEATRKAPAKAGKGASGIHGISFQMKCGGDIRKELYADVVLSVTRAFSKDVEHMTNELTEGAPSTMTSTPER